MTWFSAYHIFTGEELADDIFDNLNTDILSMLEIVDTAQRKVTAKDQFLAYYGEHQFKRQPAENTPLSKAKAKRTIIHKFLIILYDHKHQIYQIDHYNKKVMNLWKDFENLWIDKTGDTVTTEASNETKSTGQSNLTDNSKASAKQGETVNNSEGQTNFKLEESEDINAHHMNQSHSKGNSESTGNTTQTGNAKSTATTKRLGTSGNVSKDLIASHEITLTSLRRNFWNSFKTLFMNI